jgi:hypothetical protein
MSAAKIARAVMSSALRALAAINSPKVPDHREHAATAWRADQDSKR